MKFPILPLRLLPGFIPVLAYAVPAPALGGVEGHVGARDEFVDGAVHHRDVRIGSNAYGHVRK